MLSNDLLNRKNTCDGINFMKVIYPNSIHCAFFDPQYRGILEKMQYGNEGERQRGRSMLPQMDEYTIKEFIRGIDRVLIPSGYVFLWADKYHLTQGINPWLEDTSLGIVDMITWNKCKMGMGYRTRRTSEFLFIIQKHPRRAKGTFNRHDIRDVCPEKVIEKNHPHFKPINLQTALIGAVTKAGDYVLDPAAGSYSVMVSARKIKRNFIGCDLL